MREITVRSLCSGLFLVLPLAACGAPAPAADANANDGRDGALEASTADGAEGDASSADGGASDGGASDGGAMDGAAMDGAAMDGAASDGGSSGTDASSADAGSADASGADAGGGGECIGRPAGCVSGTPGGACGDAVVAPDCVSGAWRCPSGTIAITECACVGRPPGPCVCTPSGWSCGGDAGADSGPRTFACGPTLTCQSGTQYCQEFNPGAPGAMRTYSCQSLPAGCGATPTCRCFSMLPGTCSQSASGDITVRLFAP